MFHIIYVYIFIFFNTIIYSHTHYLFIIIIFSYKVIYLLNCMKKYEFEISNFFFFFLIFQDSIIIER